MSTRVGAAGGGRVEMLHPGSLGCCAGRAELQRGFFTLEMGEALGPDGAELCVCRVPAAAGWELAEV